MLYGIFHSYSVDGGYGDAIYERDLIAITWDEELAKKYVKSFNNPVIYDIPYDELQCGELYYSKLDYLLTITPENVNESPWKNQKVKDSLWPREIREALGDTTDGES